MDTPHGIFDIEGYTQLPGETLADKRRLRKLASYKGLLQMVSIGIVF